MELEFFPPALVEGVIRSCQQRGPQTTGATYTNVRELHRMLLTQLNSLPGGATAHRPQMLQVCAGFM